ncbi:GFA family protein [Lichenihabitans psoromatis]|uniref:GFA family protein n=1 Tax=Lichenihabitans psoromatis TaxID=2528642 RepID=UPI001FE21E86|nr:GFA family protein [Lichenihabitans psoromatis]
MAFVSIPTTQVMWTRGEPTWFASSSIASRGFCRACGTPLAYRQSAATIELTIGSFDDPTLIAPTSRLGLEAVLPWSETIGTLPIEATSAWLAGTAHEPVINHQHPDHDT